MAQKHQLNEIFAIECAIQGYLIPSGKSESDAIALDYVNTFNISQSEDTLNARADGKNKITLKANKAMTFSVDLEVISEDVMLMLLGAVKGSNGEIKVGSTPTTTYKYVGKAKLIFADGHKAVKDIEIPVCVPQLGADFGASSLDLQSYTLTFDCNTDENGDFLVMKDGTAE